MSGKSMEIDSSNKTMVVDSDKERFVITNGYTYVIDGERRILKLDNVNQLQDWEVDNAKEAVYQRTEGNADVYIATYSNRKVEIYIGGTEIGID